MQKREYLPPFRIVDADGISGHPVGDLHEVIGILRNIQRNRTVVVNGGSVPNPVYPPSVRALKRRRSAWHAYSTLMAHRVYGYAFVVVDDLGAIIPLWELIDLWEECFGAYDHLRVRHRDFVFRRGPVAGTRCWRGGGGLWRHVRTTQERREDPSIYDAGEEIVVPVRGKRKAGNLPSYWDDPYRHVERNWKRQRKTQYRQAG